MAAARAAEPPQVRRQAAVAADVADRELDGLLVSSAANIRYLSGFTGGSAWMLLCPGRSLLLTDGRYTEQAEAEVVGARVVVGRAGLAAAVQEAVGRRPARLGFEPGHLTVADRERLAEALPKVRWEAVSGVVEAHRRCKEPGEVEAIVRAVRLVEDALLEVADRLAPGWTEQQVAAELEYACRRRGAEGIAFDTIVASGPRSALPHGLAGARRLRAREPVMVDAGCRVDGYCSDLTRMIWIGRRPPPAWRHLHRVVEEALEAGRAAVAPGVAAAEVDRAVRQVIADAGLGDAFVHGAGHGVGLEVHEAPSLSARSHDTLEEGDVITLEPAVYQRARGGVRIEDLVCVSDKGCVRLTAMPTEPILA